MVVLEGRLPAEIGQLVAKALDAAVQELDRDGQRGDGASGSPSGSGTENSAGQSSAASADVRTESNVSAEASKLR